MTTNDDAGRAPTHPLNQDIARSVRTYGKLERNRKKINGYAMMTKGVMR